MNAIVLDDEKESLLVFSSHAIDVPNLSLNIFSSRYEEGLVYARSHKVDAAFLDIVMPGMDGVSFAKSLIEISPNIKIVFITGYAQDEEAIRKEIGPNFFAFCYKPYEKGTIHDMFAKMMSEDRPLIVFKTFPRFDMYVNGILVDFERSKAKELLALLVDHRGGEVTIEEAVTKLWIDKDYELSARLYRDATSRLRMKFNEYGISYLADFGRGRASLNCEYASCDYWDYLDGDSSLFKGEYMRPYEWGEELENYMSK